MNKLVHFDHICEGVTCDAWTFANDQSRASDDSVIVFYEICQPPYQDGRFENIAE